MNAAPPATEAVTVTAFAPPSSAIVEGLADSAMPVGAESSSVSATVALATVIDESPETDPEIVTVSPFSSALSFSGVSVKVPVALEPPFGIVMLKSATAAKPTTFEPPLPSTDTVTAVASPTVPPLSTVAVTVTTRAAAAASSATLEGLAVSVIEDG